MREIKWGAEQIRQMALEIYDQLIIDIKKAREKTTQENDTKSQTTNKKSGSKRAERT